MVETDSSKYMTKIIPIIFIIIVSLIVVYFSALITYLHYNEEGLKCVYPWYYSMFGRNNDIVADCSKDIVNRELSALMTEMNNKIAEMEQKETKHYKDISGAVDSIDKSNKDFSDKVNTNKGKVDATVGDVQSKVMNAMSSILIQSKINKETLNAVKTMNDTSINKIVNSFNKMETTI